MPSNKIISPLPLSGPFGITRVGGARSRSGKLYVDNGQGGLKWRQRVRQSYSDTDMLVFIGLIHLVDSENYEFSVP